MTENQDKQSERKTDSKEKHIAKDETIPATQRVYKKTSPNAVVTLFLPTREIILSGSTPTIIKGIAFVDPNVIQGNRIYAQLTLTFRYGREDEEVMGLRFCNEAIMSLHQVWPRTEEPSGDSLTPLQDALMKKLGDGAHPFTLNLTSQAPPSVQLVPAKRYYGAPIGTSYDVRCFIAEKTEETFLKRAVVKMAVRVIYRTDVITSGGPQNFETLLKTQSPSPLLPSTNDATLPPLSSSSSILTGLSRTQQHHQHQNLPLSAKNPLSGAGASLDAINPLSPNNKLKKSERGDSFPKLRLSPKSFRFSGRFGRSKSEIERCPSDPIHNYSKSFQEYETFSGGPQGAVDKPFLLQEGRVALRASLDKAWYIHGEDVIVTINIKNDSKKTVRKVRVSAIQHVDVCMFNNGKFKNVVADSDISSPGDRIVMPGGNFNSTIMLKPKRGATKNWIALEDSLQRSTEPNEITGAIAASAIRKPNAYQANINGGTSGVGGGGIVSSNLGGNSITNPNTTNPEDRNVFAIYVSYYVKVKLTLSGMGGELSLKLPFTLVHVNDTQKTSPLQSTTLRKHEIEEPSQLSDLMTAKLLLDSVPNRHTKGFYRKNLINSNNKQENLNESSSLISGGNFILDKIESVDDDMPISIKVEKNNQTKRKLIRCDTIVKDLYDDDDDNIIENLDNSQATDININAIKTFDPKNHKESDDNPCCEDNPKNDQNTVVCQQIICAQVHTTKSADTESKDGAFDNV